MASKGKKLRVFDFDDTLVKTDSYIYITHADGSKSKLEPEEYAIYEPREGDEFNFKDFDGPLKNPRVIERNFELFKQVLRKSASNRKTAILTARGNPAPIKKFLKKIGASSVEVITLGSSDPMKKAEWIESQINDGYDDIAFMDDSVKNIKAVNTLKRKYPKVELLTKLVKIQ